MKVGLFIDTWYPMVDGVIKVVDNYARRLLNYCDVVVFCPEARGTDYKEDSSLPYKVVRCSSLPMIRYDYNIPTPALDTVMASIMGVFNSCDECWAVNGGIKDLYVNEYGLTAPCKVRLNATDHMPVPDPAEAAAVVNRTYGVPEDATVFLFVGRINLLKNIDFTVRALAKAKARGLKNFRMLFVGRGQDEEKLAEVVREEGLSDEVVMCGLVSEREMLQNLYSRAKLFLFPSLYDANSLVQIEAACQGTPTVFIEGARTAATVKSGVNGYVSPADEESYARTIMDIMADPDGYARVSEAARRDLYLSWDDVVREVYQDYLSFLKQ